MIQINVQQIVVCIQSLAKKVSLSSKSDLILASIDLDPDIEKLKRWQSNQSCLKKLVLDLLITFVRNLQS